MSAPEELARRRSDDDGEPPSAGTRTSRGVELDEDEPEPDEDDELEPDRARRRRTSRTSPTSIDDGEPGLRLAGHAPGDLNVPDDVDLLEGEPRGTRRGVGIVAAKFNGDVTNRLLESALAELDKAGVGRDRDRHDRPRRLRAPARRDGAREDPPLLLHRRPRLRHPRRDAHFDYVAGEAASGLQLAALETGVPVAFGVLTVDTLEQALARADKGAEAVRTALEMADVFSQLRATAQASRRQRALRRYHPAAMSKICSVCGKKPGFGQHRSHSMVATKRRFNPNLQRIRVARERHGQARLRLHALPQGRQDPKSRLATALARCNRAAAAAGLSSAVEARHAPSELGRITISSDAIAHIVGETARECYGVVGMAARGPVGKLLGRRERSPRASRSPGTAGGGVTIDLRVVVEYGLNLAEVASTVRNRVAYEVERLTGLPVRPSRCTSTTCGGAREPERRSRGDAEGRRLGARLARGQPQPHRRPQRVSRCPTATPART